MDETGEESSIVRETALDLIQRKKAVLVDPAQPGALDFIPDFTIAELNPQAQLRQVESLSEARPPEVPSILAGTRRRRSN